MVLILSRAHAPFPLSTSSGAPDIEDIQDPSIIFDGKTADLATTHPQWNLPMRRERMGPSKPPILLGSNSKSITNHSTHGRKNLEVNTAINYTLDSSSNSLSSASTMASEEALSSEADADEDEAMDSEDTEIVPKVEEEIDEASMEDIKTTESSGSPEARLDSTGQAITEIKKKRGRPRKNPPTTSTASSKVAKGRSKTGCITCRRRKKKCDEAKPSCKWPSRASTKRGLVTLRMISDILQVTIVKRTRSSAKDILSKRYGGLVDHEQVNRIRTAYKPSPGTNTARLLRRDGFPLQFHGDCPFSSMASRLTSTAASSTTLSTTSVES